MIVGVGVDLCEVARIEKLLHKNADHFLKRLLASGEVCAPTPVAVAKCFAVKEAVSKALGTGIGAQLSFQDITLKRKDSGQPYVVLSSAAQERFQAPQLHVSLSDEAGLVVAYVVAQRGEA